MPTAKQLEFATDRLSDVCPSAQWPRRILIIDDDLPLAELIQELLEESGYLASVHSTSAGASELVLRELPDLVLLDLRMGGRETGWEILDRHVLNPATRDIPVLLCSGDVESLRSRSRALVSHH